MRHYKPREQVVAALRKSAFLDVSEDGKTIKRKIPLEGLTILDDNDSNSDSALRPESTLAAKLKKEKKEKKEKKAKKAVIPQPNKDTPVRITKNTGRTFLAVLHLCVLTRTFRSNPMVSKSIMSTAPLRLLNSKKRRVCTTRAYLSLSALKSPFSASSKSDACTKFTPKSSTNGSNLGALILLPANLLAG